MRKHLSPLFLAIMILSGIGIFLSGCYKDNFDFDRMKEDMVTWEPDLAFPVVYSILGAEEIIGLSDSTNIYQYDNENFITLIYRKQIFSQKINDFFQLPTSQSVDETISLSPAEIGTFTGTGTVQTTVNGGLTLSLSGPGGSQLDKVLYMAGTMNIAFTSDFEHSGTLQVSMPEMRLNGTPFTQTYVIDYQGSPVSVNVSIPLTGYEMDLDNGTGANTIPIDYTLTLNQGGGANPTPANTVAIDHSFENMRMAFADGYFGNFDLEIVPAQVDLDVIQSEHEGHIYFEDPRLKLRVKNTIGAEIDVTVEEFNATGDLGQIDVDISSEIPGGMFTIQPAPAIGDSSLQEFYFTQSNSNIKPIINNEYEEVNHDLSAEVNPNGAAYNFADHDGAVEVIADVELPFWGFSNHFAIVDTLEVPFSEGEEFADNVERGLLRINTLSHFPVDAILKLYFADSAYNVIDSVLTDGSFVARSGEVNADGKVISAVHTNNDVELDSTRIHSLFDANFLLLATDLTSTDDASRNIKVYLEDNIEVRIGLRVKLKASPSDIDDF